MAERYTIKSERLGALLRYEITVEEYFEGIPMGPVVELECYSPCWSDLDALLSNIREKDPDMKTLAAEWGEIFNDRSDELTDTLDELVGTEDFPEDVELWQREHFRPYLADHIKWQDMDREGDMGLACDFLGVTSQGDGFNRICSSISELSFDEDYRDEKASSGAIDFKRILADAELIKAQKFDLDIRGWKWTDKAKFEALERPEGSGFGGPAIDPEELPEAREILNELCARGSVRALHMRAYAAYGGSYLWPCDWNVSRDSLLKLMDMENVGDQEKAVYANTLGYIYYYGRCTDNVPDYDSALKYFLVGAAAGVHESIYKLADMLKDGKGVPKNMTSAMNMLLDAYRRTSKDFLVGNDDSDFADAALRVGTILHEIGDLSSAMTILLQADYAVHERMKANDCYGDDNVAMAIRKEISSIRREFPKTETGDVANFPLMKIIDGFVYDPGPARGYVEETPEHVDLAVIAHYNDARAFITIPESGYCTVSDIVRYRFEDVERFHSRRNRKEFIFDRYETSFDEEKNMIELKFFRDDTVVCEIAAGEVSIALPEDEDMIVPGGDTHVLAACSFTEDGKTYDYLADGMEVEEGDRAVVDTWQGETEVFVMKVYEMTEAELPLPLGDYKKLVRVIS